MTPFMNETRWPGVNKEVLFEARERRNCRSNEEGVRTERAGLVHNEESFYMNLHEVCCLAGRGATIAAMASMEHFKLRGLPTNGGGNRGKSDETLQLVLITIL